MKLNNDCKPLDDFRVWKAGQSVWFEQHWSVFGEVVVITIKRNAYDDQSDARAQIYGPIDRKWNRLVQLPIADLPCAEVSDVLFPAEKTTHERLMLASADKLLAKVVLIIAAAPPPNRA